MSELELLKTTSGCEEYYQKLHTTCGDIINSSFEADDGSHSKNHHFIVDFETWIQVLSTRPEVNLFKFALREYQFGLLALVQGQYRQAFMA
ncbi:hypothetical protein, partial [Methanococcoides sp.]|uniref:hypothetical protein n=1 Tax=Methanococcoides sp. TaxID=1966350 RepID=UPI00272DE86A